MIGVYWGRFNPPHHGHMGMVKKLLLQTDVLVIAVGSAEDKNTARNPFSGAERVRMWKAFLKEERIPPRKVRVVAVPDGPNWAAAVENLFSRCEPFDVLFTDKEAAIQTIGKRAQVRRIRRTGTISSTKIRDAIAAGQAWEQFTGASVARLVKRYGGIERIQHAYEQRKKA